MKTNIPRLRAKLIIPLLLSLLLPSLTVVRLLDHQNWLTGANQVHWVLPDGHPAETDPFYSEIFKKIGCYDTEDFYALRDKGVLWTTCYLGDQKQALVRIDPGNGTGTLWRLPKDFAHISGLARGREGEIAIVYTALNVGEISLGLGVIDHETWKLNPQILPDSKDSKLLATSWVRGQLEIIYLPPYAMDSDNNENVRSIVATIHKDKIVTKSLIPPVNLCRPQATGKIKLVCDRICRLTYEKENWRLWVFKPDTQTVEEVSETGEITALDKQENCGKAYQDEDSITAAKFKNDESYYALGLVQESDYEAVNRPNSWLQTLGGKLIPLPQPPKQTWKRYLSHGWVEFGDTGLLKYSLWELPREDHNFAYARKISTGWLESKHDENDRLHLALLDTNGNVIKSRIVAKDNHQCDGPYTGVPIMRNDGGFWLVNTNGCYISMSNDLKRLDPYSIVEHFRKDDPSWSSWKYSNITRLIWVLAGLPVCIFLLTGIARWRKKPLFIRMVVGTYIYLVSAGICLFQLWPLLK